MIILPANFVVAASVSAFAVCRTQHVHWVLSQISLQESLRPLRKHHRLPLVLKRLIPRRQHRRQIGRLRDPRLRKHFLVMFRVSLIFLDGLSFDHSFRRHSVGHL